MATTVNAAFTELQRRLALTPKQREIAASRLASLRAYFSATCDVSRTPWAIGSYGRETIIRPERDIDIMVALSAPAYWDAYRRDSRAFLRWLRDGLNRQYANTQVGVRQIAVHLALGEGLEVDLVPAFDVVEVAGRSFLTRYIGAKPGDRGFWIPDGSGGWQKTNPPFHDKLVSGTNRRLDSRLKPLVRVMKAWNVMSNRARLMSFHLELICERVWRKAESVPPPPRAVAATLGAAGSLVRDRFRDPWSDSGQNLDAYLSADAKAATIKRMAEDAVRGKAALDFAAAGNRADAFERWQIVFSHQFPAYG
jgi:hypothetical protein